MATPRETRGSATPAIRQGSLRGPRASVGGSTGPTTTTADAARRKRERESVVLAQIVAHATRLRDGNIAPPLTLIELIQASSAVFAKHGIQPPEDAVFHRYLLTLSLDPEHDWKKKIHKLLALTPASRSRVSPHASSVGSTSKAAQRTTSMATSEMGFQTSVRRRSGVGAEPRPPGWVPPGVASSSGARTPMRQTKRQSVDHFGDVLVGQRPATPIETKLKENQLRTAAMVEVGTATDDELAKAKSETPVEKLTGLERIRARLNELNAELTVEGEDPEVDDDKDGDDDKDEYASLNIDDNNSLDAVSIGGTFSDSVQVGAIPAHAYYPPPSMAETVEDDSDYQFDAHSNIPSPTGTETVSSMKRLSTDSFRRLATSFQQWKEIIKFHQLVRESRQREMKITQALLPPIATFAIFRWVGITLPPTNGSVQTSLAVPSFVVSRRIAISNPAQLRHFTGRLLVWTIHRMFTTWARSARAIKTVRIKSLIRQRTEVLETAYECLQTWCQYVKKRRKTADQGVWVQTLHERKCQRHILRIWRNELLLRNRQLAVLEQFRQRRVKSMLRRWRRWAKLRLLAQSVGKRRILTRSLQAWQCAVRWSDVEHQQLVTSRVHFDKRTLQKCWSVWRGRTSQLKAKRFRMLMATNCARIKTMRQIWIAWRDSYKVRRSLMVKYMRFTKRSQSRAIRSIFSAILAYVHNKKYCALVVMDACGRREDRQLKRVWQVWIDHHASVVQDDQQRVAVWNTRQTRHFLSVWKRQTSLMRLSSALKSCFSSDMTQRVLRTWKQVSDKRRYFRSLVSDWRSERDQMMKERVFKSFRENVKIGRIKHEAAQGFLNRCSDTRLQSFVWAWKGVIRVKRARCIHDQLNTDKCKRLQLARTWTIWRQAFHVVRCVQIADLMIAQSFKRRCIQLWRQAVQMCKRIRQSTNELHRYMTKRAVRKLRGQAERRKHCRCVSLVVSTKFASLVLRTGWNAWRTVMDSARQRHVKATQLVLHWQNKQVALCFVEWKALHVKRRELKTLLSKWQEGEKAKSVDFCWKGWLLYIALKHERNAVIDEARLYFERRSIKGALETWRFRCSHSQEQAMVMQKCVDMWARNRIGQLLTHWKRYVQLRRVLRMMNGRKAGHIRKKCFDNWCKWKRRREEAALHFADLTKKLSLWSSHRAIQRLRKHALSSKRSVCIRGLVKLAGARGLQTTSFRRWTQYARTRSHQRALTKSRAASLQKFRVWRCIQKWERFTRLKQLLASTLGKAQNRNKSELTARVFAVWRQFVMDRKMFNALKEKATVFQVLCMLPTYFHAWKRFITDRRHRQALIEKASKMLLYQQESKAFRSWRDITARAKRARNALRIWQSKSMLDRLERWKQFVLLQRANSSAVAHYRLTTRTRIVREWHEATRRQRLLKHFSELWSAQTIAEYFKRWVVRIHLTKCARALLRRLQNASLSRIFNSWKSLSCSQKLQCTQIQQRFVLLWNQDRVMTSFQRWKALVTRQKLLKQRMLQRMTKQTSALFSHWKLMVKKCKRVSQQVVLVQQNNERSLLVKSWGQWRREKAKYDKVNILRSRIVLQSSGAFAWIIFQEWKKIAPKLVAVKFSRMQADKRFISHIFISWKDRFVAKRKSARQYARVIQKRSDFCIVKKVLLRMRARMTIKNACTRIFRPQLERHLLVQVWHSWSKYYRVKKHVTGGVAQLRESIARLDPDCHRAVHISLMRWRALKQAQLFDHWSSISFQSRWIRKHTAKAMGFWHLRLSTYCFRSWRRWIDHQRCKRALESRCSMRRKSYAWSLWTVYHRVQRFRKFLIGKAVNFHRKKVHMIVLAEWRHVLERRHHFDLLATSLMLHRTQRSLGKWHAFAAHMRSHRLQTTLATVTAHHKLASYTWNRWKQFVHHVQTYRRELQQHTERLQILVLCSTFRAWRAWSQQQCRASRLIALLTYRCDVKTARKILSTWSQYANGMKVQRSMVSTFHWANATRNAVRLLRKHALNRSSNRGATEKARKWVEVLQGRHLRSSFQRWQRFKSLATLKRLAITGYSMKKLLPSAFNAWKAFVQVTHVKNDRLDRAVKCWRFASVRRAWAAWSACQQKNVANTYALVRAKQHFRFRLLRLVIVVWRRTVVKQQLMDETCRKLLVRWKLQTSYRCFANWHEYALQCKAQRVRAAMVVSRFANAQLRQAWSEWRLLFVVARVGVRKQLARVFDAWHRWRFQRHEWFEFQARQSNTLLRTVRARAGIRRWRDFVVQTKMAKTMALLSSRFSNDTIVKRSFGKWLLFLIVRNREKEKMKQVLVWLRSRQVMACFQALLRYSRDQQHRKHCQVVAERHAKHRATSKAFSAWKNITTTTKSQRIKLRRYVDVMQHVVQRKSFVAWRDCASKRAQLKTTCANLLSQRTALTTRALLNEWKCYTIKMKRLKAAAMFSHTNLYGRSFRQWRKFVTLSRVERMLGASEQRLLERSFLGWRKRASIHKTVRILSRDKMERDSRCVLKRFFTAWNTWTKIQTKCTSLLASVAVGHHLRFRFLIWTKFTAKSKQLKRLVLGARSLGSGVATLGSGTPITDRNDNDEAQAQLEDPAMRLTRAARFFQQFQVNWDDSASVWQRWRHAFHARLFYRMRRLHKCYSVWSQWSRRRRYVKLICASRLASTSYTLKKTLFMRWREVVVNVKQIQRERRRERELLVIVNAEMVRQERKMLQRHWNAWRERTENKRHLMVSVNSYLRARVLTKFWLLWSHDFVHLMRQKHDLHKSRCGQLATTRMRQAIFHLLSNRVRRRQERHVVTALACIRHRRWYGVVFDQWKRFADTKRRARLLVIFKTRQHVRSSFQAWSAWLQSRRDRNVAVENLVQRRIHTIRLNAYQRWRAFGISRRRREDAMILATRFLLQHCIRQRWYCAVQNKISHRQMFDRQNALLVGWRQRRVVRKWNAIVRNECLDRKLKHFVQRKRFLAWRLYVHRLLADRFWARILQNRLQSVFNGWSSWTHRRVHHRTVQQLLIARVHKRWKRELWLGWQDFLQSKQKEHVAVDHYTHLLLLKTLLHWHANARAERAERGARLVVASEFHAFSIKRSVIHRWILALVRARQRRAVLLTCVVKIQQTYSQRLQQVTLQMWADAADLKRFSRECARILQQQRVQRAIHNWRRRIHERRRFEQLQHDASVYRRNRLLSAVFFHWQNYALAWKDAMNARASQRTPPIRVVSTPAPVAPLDTSAYGNPSDDEEDSPMKFRRPLSPMKKRVRAKAEARTDGPCLVSSPPVPSFADAASLSLDVKKRLLVLGKWKPAHKSLSHV